jgi:hypothetical protein
METTEQFEKRKLETYQSILSCLKTRLRVHNDITVITCLGCDNDYLCGLICQPIRQNYKKTVLRRMTRLTKNK